MNITFKSLKLVNFKNHKALGMDFGDITNISGRNGVGKSSIGDSVTWLLYGTDILGNKLDPKPVGTDEESIVELLLTIDGSEILLLRSQKKTAKYSINGVPEKATKFNELIDSLFDKNLFLSLFNPSYFFTQHWQDQRSQLLSYVKEPLNKEILATMSKLDSELLEAQLKKYPVDDLEKVHRENFRKNDKNYDRAAERVLTLQDQLEKVPAEEFDEAEVKSKIEKLRTQRDELDEKNLSLQQSNSQRNRIEAQIESLNDQIERQRKVVAGIKEEQIKESCHTCGQALDEESISKVKENRQARFNKEVMNGKELVEKLNNLKQNLAALPETIEVDRSESIRIDDQIVALQSKLHSVVQINELKQAIEVAKTNKESVRQERNESRSIVDAIKTFRTKRSELMVAKVDNLFTKISVRLYEQLKNGEEKATFEIEMDGKPYSKLSTAEKIKAGLELIEVLSTQSEVIAPTFVDNAESILNFTKPSGQLIVARVVDAEFSINPVSLKEEK
ncbi:AAA family ATPase [Metabacillus idriensis]|uniref:AAA family ATPase n=1 Tax=Metabacillus idriensis TaxID=324768 RepID=UPI00174BDA70|nr:AAA family ATPase [Metabacillus idriensis]MCM3598976.1 AAA family ATPase [Metabacillus idriensis]